MIVLAFLELGYGRWLAATRRHAEQRPRRARREQHVAVGLPRAAASDRRISDSLDRQAVDIEPLQLGIGEETDRRSVRRPEG